MRAKRWRGSRGTSASEVLVSMFITLVMAAGGVSFYRSETRELFDQSADHGALDAARAALDFMARDIRRAGLDPGDAAFRSGGIPVSGATGVSLARANRIQIEADRNGSGSIEAAATDPDAESVQYAYDAAGRQIVRTVGGTARTLIAGVPPSGLVFEYFGPNGASLPLTGTALELTASQRDQVAMVRIHVQVEVNGARGLLRRTLSTRILLRNRMLEAL